MNHTHLGAYGALAVPAEGRFPDTAAQGPAALVRMDDLAQRIARDIHQQQRVRDGLALGALLGASLLGLALVLA